LKFVKRVKVLHLQFTSFNTTARHFASYAPTIVLQANIKEVHRTIV